MTEQLQTLEIIEQDRKAERLHSVEKGAEVLAKLQGQIEADYLSPDFWIDIPAGVNDPMTKKLI